MSLIAGGDTSRNVDSYGQLERTAQNTVDRINKWMIDLQNLNTTVTDPAEKAECAALRQKFQDDVTIALGI